MHTTQLVKLFNFCSEKSTNELHRVSKTREVGVAIKIARTILLSGKQRINIASGERDSQRLLVSFKYYQDRPLRKDQCS